MSIKKRGVMLVLSSPSGAGKSTIARSLLENDKNIQLSVSVTTRKKRPSEIDGVHYRFISQKEFDHMAGDNELLEWATVHGNSYGTPRAEVEAALQEGIDVLFDIDWQGTLQLYQTSRSDIASIFVLPPSMKELKARLIRRAEDDDDVIARRLANAREEISHWNEYDYVLINSDLDETYNNVRDILSAERKLQRRDAGLEEFVNTLLAEELT